MPIKVHLGLFDYTIIIQGLYEWYSSLINVLIFLLFDNRNNIQEEYLTNKYVTFYIYFWFFISRSINIEEFAALVCNDSKTIKLSEELPLKWNKSNIQFPFQFYWGTQLTWNKMKAEQDASFYYHYINVDGFHKQSFLKTSYEWKPSEVRQFTEAKNNWLN